MSQADALIDNLDVREKIIDKPRFYRADESFQNMQNFIHYFLHLGFPLLIAYGFFKKDWKKVYFILLATMFVDLDHLVANPIFQANRCSINFHPLHTYNAMIVYVILLFIRKPFNIIGIGLLFHVLTDFIDCLMMCSNCKVCFSYTPAIGLLSTVPNALGI